MQAWSSLDNPRIHYGDRRLEMRKRILATLTLVTFAMILLAAQSAVTAQVRDRGEAALKAAMDKELIEGDLKGAIEQYKKIAESKDRALAAKALVHMADCYQKLGNTESRKIYEQVVKSYSDQNGAVTLARARLAALDGVRTEKLAVRHVYTTREDFPASLTPDGHFMGVSDGSKVGVRDMTTGETKWLTNDDPMLTEPECTILSPDQRQVVYAWYPRRNGVMYGEVRLIANQAGSKPRVLIPGSEEYEYVDPLAWAPDGKSLLITIHRRDQTWQLGWASVADGAIKVLKSLQWRVPRSASLSPDGKYIAYSTLVTNPGHPIRATVSLIGFDWSTHLHSRRRRLY